MHNLLLDIDTVLLCAASFTGAFLNAVAGGGTFITLPALVSVGVPPIVANGTSTSVLLSGYIASSWGFRHRFSEHQATVSWSIIAVTVTGSVIGALLLVYADNDIFSFLLPWLMLFATLLFCFSPLITKNTTGLPFRNRQILLVALFALSSYGGFFNGGLGILILAVFSIFGYTEINDINALKNIISLLLTGTAVLVYFYGDLVDTSYLLPMTAAAVAGGSLGASIGQRIPPTITRGVIVLTGTVLTIIFFTKS